MELARSGSRVGCHRSFVYSTLLVWAFSQWHRFSLTYYSKFYLLLAFCFLFVSMVEQIQMFPLSIPPLGLFKGIICNVERLKEGTLEPWITGRPKLEGETWFEKLKGILRSLFIRRAYCFYVKKILVDFLTCISVPLKFLDMDRVAFPKFHYN